MQSNWTLYEHISPSGKVYVGITSLKPEYRWNHGKGYMHGDLPVIEAAIIKYGWDNFLHIIVASNLGEKTAKNMEKDLIKFYKNKGVSYNITDGGDGLIGVKSMLGKKHSEETKRRMSTIRQGTHIGKDNPMYGRHKDNYFYGKFSNLHPASKCVLQYTKEGRFVKEWDCLSDVQRELGIIVTHITACCKGRQKSAGGYVWKYKPNKTSK